MSRAHMGNPSIVAAGLVVLCTVALARPASGAMTLSSLTDPTVQTLIDLGSDGATAGGARYFDFSYAASANAPVAGAVQIQAIDTTDAGGLRFVASWVASNGAAVSSTVSYDVAPLDGSPIGGSPIGGVTLLFNGTAPVPATETFATATMSTDTVAGSPVAPILTTYDDGRTFPTDTTAADVDSGATSLSTPQSPLAVTDTLTLVAGSGGLATASFVQNGFTFATGTTAAVPEPTLGLALVAVALGGRRRRDAKAK